MRPLHWIAVVMCYECQPIPIFRRWWLLANVGNGVGCRVWMRAGCLWLCLWWWWSQGMFWGATSFNHNLSFWETSKVTNMHVSAVIVSPWWLDGDALIKGRRHIPILRRGGDCMLMWEMGSRVVCGCGMGVCGVCVCVWGGGSGGGPRECVK